MVGKVALVTGAGQGIGKAIALKLASLGAAVVAMDLNGENAQTTAGEIRSMGQEALALQVNVTDIASLRTTIDSAIKKMGSIDILVPCAGVAQAKDIFGITEAEWDATIDVNLKALFFTNQIVLKHMCDRGSGAVVNLASIGGRSGRAMMAPYAASKAGVINLTQSFALAVGPHGVRVNSVCPGVVATAMWKKLGTEFAGGDESKSEEMRIARSSLAPLPGEVTVEDVANLVAFLASDQAKHLHGQAVNIDCGFEMD